VRLVSFQSGLTVKIGDAAASSVSQRNVACCHKQTSLPNLRVHQCAHACLGKQKFCSAEFRWRGKDGEQIWDDGRALWDGVAEKADERLTSFGGGPWTAPVTGDDVFLLFCNHASGVFRCIEPIKILQHPAYFSGKRVVDVHTPAGDSEDWHLILVGNGKVLIVRSGI
jgi:hypothetical protein